MVTFNFHRTNTVLGKLIRFFSGGMVNHVSIQIGEWIWEADFKRGVVKTDISKWNKQHQIVCQYIVYTPYQSTIVYWLNKQVGKKYDWIGVFSFVWVLLQEKKGSFYCSELAMVVLMKAVNVHSIDYNHKQSPYDLLLLMQMLKSLKVI